MQALTDFLLPLFLALGSLWFAVDLIKKLRAPAPRPEPAPASTQLSTIPAPEPLAPPATAIPAAPPSAPSLSQSPTPSVPASLPPAHLAVIAATIHHLFRGRARVVGVAPAGAHAAAVDWAREGRRDIFSSHRLR